MRLVTYLSNGKEQLALLIGEDIYTLNQVDEALPKTMKEFLNNWDEVMPRAREAEDRIKSGAYKGAPNARFETATLMAPVPYPTSCRDGYAFRQHVAAARRNRKVEMIPQFDEYPVFYFTNHNAIQGPGEVRCMPDHFERLDFELEAAVVICRKGRNISAQEADSYIGGYMIMNDFSARRLQMEEMMLNLGPAKGKDFSTAIGPMLVTADELEPFKVPAKKNHTGNNYDLTMTCRVNGKEVSRGNLADMDWTFAEIIERCAYGVNILPGDIIGSGTVGTGCFLELNGTGLFHDPNYQTQWLQPGDVVELEIEQLGVLKNTIVKEPFPLSLFNLKKKLS